MTCLWSGLERALSGSHESPGSTRWQGLTQEVQAKQLRAYYEAVLEPDGVLWGGFFYDKATSGGTPLTERAAA